MSRNAIRGEAALSCSPTASRVPRLRLHRDLVAGARPAPSNHTVRQAAEDWLAHGLPGRSGKTIRKNRDVLEPILAAVGTRRLKELTSADVGAAPAHMAASYSTAAVAMGHLALNRVIRRAQAHRYVTINAAEFADTRKRQPGRPSKIPHTRPGRRPAARSDGIRIGAYIALSLGTGIRTEEAHAHLWEHVDLGDPRVTAPRPASTAVWRSVRAHGDTKTPSSRRTLVLPAIAADAPADQQQRERRNVGPVFAIRGGLELDAANIRREFRTAVKAAGIDGTWSPRGLRHTFVSLMSDSGVPVEEIAASPAMPPAAPPNSSTATSSAPSWKRRPGSRPALQTHRLNNHPDAPAEERAGVAGLATAEVRLVWAKILDRRCPTKTSLAG